MVTPPTAQQWEQHRSVIVDLYSRRPLKAVRAHMRETYGFLATDHGIDEMRGMVGQTAENNHPQDHHNKLPCQTTSTSLLTIASSLADCHQTPPVR
ncbi:hypothetical protein CFRS1_v009794 [Colletotrichum fructicola]|nr:hypothetical protein CFRS1_v009794 [Colletotrichum fructicola]